MFKKREKISEPNKTESIISYVNMKLLMKYILGENSCVSMCAPEFLAGGMMENCIEVYV